jgi:hypothetical protein
VKQSKVMSLIETLSGIAIGFGVSLAAQMWVLPLLGVAIDFHQNLEFALIMTVVSIVRQFGVRRLFEKLHIRRPLSPAMHAVIAERFRQIEGEGFGHTHDDAHAAGELARAGACYLAIAGRGEVSDPPRLWPWADQWWNPKDTRRDLVRGLALALAELERFDRKRKEKNGERGA